MVTHNKGWVKMSIKYVLGDVISNIWEFNSRFKNKFSKAKIRSDYSKKNIKLTIILLLIIYFLLFCTLKQRYLRWSKNSGRQGKYKTRFDFPSCLRVKNLIKTIQVFLHLFSNLIYRLHHQIFSWYLHSY